MTVNFEVIFRQFAEPIAVYDNTGRIIYCNVAYEKLFGKVEEGRRCSSFNFVDENGYDKFSELLALASQGKSSNESMFFMIFENGDRLPIHITLSPIFHKGEVRFIVCLFQNATRLTELETALSISELRLQLVTEHTSDYVMILTESGEISYVSPKISEIMNVKNGMVLEDILNEYIHPEDLPNLKETIRGLYTECKPCRVEFRKHGGNGEWFWFEASGKPICNENNEVDCIVLTVKHIHERKNYELKLHYLENFDSLTGIPNRCYFEKFMKKLIDRNVSFALCYIDFDKFKYINDHFSHRTGDFFLQSAVQKIEGMLQSEDFFARLGGDEFALLLPKRTKEEVQTIADTLTRLFRQPFYFGNEAIQTTLSVGIAFYPSDGNNMEIIMKRADQALYHVKEHGKNGYHIYHPEENRKVIIEMDLPFAISKNQFYLCYQPKIELGSGYTMGVEALIRWNHPTLGHISPMEFIPLAEQSGYIFQLTLWVLENSCRQVKEWHDEFPELNLAVNLSPYLLNRTELFEFVVRILKELEFPPEKLILEVTESGLMENIETGKHILSELSQIGVRVAIDDFGTGFSSLAYIRNLPVSLLKIDRSFIKEITESSKDATIVDTIIHLAKGLDIEVLAEGVEDINQVSLLQQMKCDFAQGFFYSKSLKAEKLKHWLEKHNRSASSKY